MKRVVIVMVIGLLSILPGCASRAAFVYKPSGTVATGKATLPLKVAVKGFDDQRTQENTNAVLLYLIPIVPYGSLNYDRPDAANGFLFHAAYNFRPSEDFAKALVSELNQNNYFSEVFFTERPNEPNIDLIVTGQIKETRYDGKMISYGLSAEGPLLWILGLPAGTTHNAINLTLEMKRATDGVVVWTHEVKGEWDKTVGLYYNWAADFDGYPLIMSEGLHKGMEKLAKDISEKDIDYWKGVKTPHQ
jgi:hypothetical protein